MDGVIVIRKEKGFTSHDVVAKLRGILHMKKIGHTGTLDPDAEGVLPVALGKATRLVDMITDKEKTYEAVMRLGVVTDTQDMSGTVLSQTTELSVTEEELCTVVSSFVGDYMGKAFPNEKVFLLDEEDKLITEKNKNGELCVTGSALALGYYKNREQTAKVFVQNPLNDRYLEPMYRTGDLAYYNERGELCFATRKDFQIKHMGHRIELGEIEAAMDKVPEIVRSCCIFDTVKSKIVAFYEGDIERRPLAKALGQYVPAFMVPNVFRQVESMPLTKNGKIDRKALTAMYQEEKK